MMHTTIESKPKSLRLHLNGGYCVIGHNHSTNSIYFFFSFIGLFQVHQHSAFYIELIEEKKHTANKLCHIRNTQTWEIYDYEDCLILTSIKLRTDLNATWMTNKVSCFTNVSRNRDWEINTNTQFQSHLIHSLNFKLKFKLKCLSFWNFSTKLNAHSLK